MFLRHAPLQSKLSIALLCIAFFAIASGTSFAQPGPDPTDDHPEFYIKVWNRNTGHNYLHLGFPEGNPGWDFGDRAAYRCAWVEYFEGPDLLFTVTIERLGDKIGIVDAFGLEAVDTACPSEPGGVPTNVRFDGSDHFPHGTALTVARAGTPIATLRLHRMMCAHAYWAPGDEPGEAWLWWDRDGPTSDGHHMLDCGGGHRDPKPVARAIVSLVASDLSVCTEDTLDGAICST